MMYPQTGYEGWPTLSDEEEQLALRRDCLEDMEATIKRLREIVAQAPLTEAEQQVLFYQIKHIQHHLKESVNMAVADELLRTNDERYALI